jgi:hypothetical protein
MDGKPLQKIFLLKGLAFSSVDFLVVGWGRFLLSVYMNIMSMLD